MHIFHVWTPQSSILDKASKLAFLPNNCIRGVLWQNSRFAGLHTTEFSLGNILTIQNF